MKEIILNNGMIALVDDEDFHEFSKKKWHSFPHGKNFYARSHHRFMHREVLGIVDPKIKIDHADGNGLNNQKTNLRICTHSQNMGNRSKNVNGSSRFKGVTFHKRDKVYVAAIGMNKKRLQIGNYEAEIEAALVYNCAASFAFRQFARLNVIPI